MNDQMLNVTFISMAVIIVVLLALVWKVNK